MTNSETFRDLETSSSQHQTQTSDSISLATDLPNFNLSAEKKTLLVDFDGMKKRSRLVGINEELIYQVTSPYIYRHFIFLCFRSGEQARIALSCLAVEEELLPDLSKTSLFMLKKADETHFIWELRDKTHISSESMPEDTSSICIKIESTDTATLRKKCSFYYQTLTLISRISEEFDLGKCVLT